LKIICIGRNYAQHAAELNNPIPKEPVVFIKPDSAVLVGSSPFFIPDFSSNVQYELELTVKINRLGKHIEERFAHKYYDQIGLGLDFTARDVQEELKSKGLPWEKAKAFDGSAVIGDFIPKAELVNNADWDFYLLKNQEKVQEGNRSQMLFSIDRIISEVSKYFTLKIGDVIFTGTPHGVGSIAKEDLLEGYLNKQKLLSTRVK
jgi:2-keto-4-pentenoate hydratase/2-oxohepta-3-ene-1,7-dioic acid hydratase in catechol pathway